MPARVTSEDGADDERPPSFYNLLHAALALGLFKRSFIVFLNITSRVRVAFVAGALLLGASLAAPASAAPLEYRYLDVTYIIDGEEQIALGNGTDNAPKDGVDLEFMYAFDNAATTRIVYRYTNTYYERQPAPTTNLRETWDLHYVGAGWNFGLGLCWDLYLDVGAQYRDRTFSGVNIASSTDTGAAAAIGARYAPHYAYEFQIGVRFDEFNDWLADAEFRYYLGGGNYSVGVSFTEGSRTQFARIHFRFGF